MTDGRKDGGDCNIPDAFFKKSLGIKMRLWYQRYWLYSVGALKGIFDLVVGPVAVGSFAFLFGCTLVGRASDSIMVLTWRLVC